MSAFLTKLEQTPVRGTERGRLVFAMDATASRQFTWDQACYIQAMMFEEAGRVGGLDIQLIFFRGFRECKSTAWISSAQQLQKLMTSVQCLAGKTQIRKVLKKTLEETQKKHVNALVFVGDAMEEDVDELGHLAGQLGLHAVPCFMFHEGRDPLVENVYRQVARLSGGAYCPFDEGAAQQLRELLSAVAVFAAGGRRALTDFSKGKKGGATLLLTQLGK
ncbi:VWA domain-containing protein [Kiloniella laminariae]|uniref:VWA domain-containing protein n=1 Tax=Kiloniella laminariae TaxID=454162 RepID=UPI0022B0C352|nr:VWA domain-containing protein [Kiloniella laminariae]